MSPAHHQKVKQCCCLGGTDNAMNQNIHKPKQAAQGNSQAPAPQLDAQCS